MSNIFEVNYFSDFLLFEFAVPCRAIIDHHAILVIHIKLYSEFSSVLWSITDKVREANGCVLVHCLAGISRSPTLAIAYVMKYLNTTSEEAYK